MRAQLLYQNSVQRPCATRGRLKERLVGCADWEGFPGACTVHKTLGGCGNVDDNVLEISTGTWSIWWLDSRHPRKLDVPVVGRFVDGVGKFVADDVLNGKPINSEVRMDTSSP
jgi:hypothetical protein